MQETSSPVIEVNPGANTHSGSLRSPALNERGTIASPAIPSKITPPSGEWLFPRTRLFEILDIGRQQSPVVWINAPGGSGKTSLVASYLHERCLKAIWYKVDSGDADVASFFHYLNMAAQSLALPGDEPLPSLTTSCLPILDTFARNYFRDLYRRLPTQSLIVLDNYENVPYDSPFCDLLLSAMQEIPNGLNLVILSRVEPTPSIARLRMSGRVMQIDWAMIRFTLEEITGLSESRLGKTQLCANVVQQVYDRTQGWAAGLMLTLEQCNTFTACDSHQVTASRKLLFNYFTSEIFARFSPETCDFLVKTALFPKTTADMAVELTGHSNTKEILTELVQCNLFPVVQTSASATENSYEYHPLFREFLLTRFESDIAAQENLTLQRKAAKILLDAGYLNDSVDLLIRSKSWETLSVVVLNHARMLVAEDNGAVLARWIKLIPEDLRRDIPWLDYWLGVCRLPYHPQESRGILEEVYARFTDVNDLQGRYLSWCAIVESIVFEGNDFTPLDHWLDEAQRLQAQPLTETEMADKFSGAMFTALAYRRPQRELVAPWEEKVAKIVICHPDFELRSRLGNSLLYYKTSVKGDLFAAETILQDLRPSVNTQGVSPLVRKMFGAIVAAFLWTSGHADQCLTEVEEAREIGREKGVDVWDNFLWTQSQSVILASSRCQSAKTQESIGEQFSPTEQLLNKMMCHYFHGWRALQQGDMNMAARHAEIATEMARISGSPAEYANMQLAWSIALYHQGNRERAKELLSQSRALGKLFQSAIISYISALAEAEFALLEGQNNECLGALREALFISRTNGIRMHGWFRHELMARLYVLALEHNIEEEYVRRVIKQLKLYPPADSVIPDNWPYPLKIYTLGKFVLVKDGEPLMFEGKVQKKPLALLKLLVALGGRDVSEIKITEVLWPDADGDVAHANLKPAVHRLRKLIGDEIILWHEGRISINPLHCWVDAWAFQRLAGELMTGRGDVARIERLCALYQGLFLSGEEETYAIVPAEGLRAKFLAAVQHCGQNLYERGAHNQAIALYNRGLEVEPLAETFYQGLMRAHQALMQPAEGLCVYRRCLKLLRSQLGIEPNPETQTLARTLGCQSS